MNQKTLPPTAVTVPGDDNWLSEESSPQPFDLWTRANFGEVLPNPVTPLTLSSLGMVGGAAEVRLPTGEKVQMARRFYGRIYANEGGMRQFVAELGLPTSFIDATWGSRRPDLPPKAGFRPWRLFYRVPQLVLQSAKSARQKPASEALLPKEEAALYAQIETWSEEFRQIDLAALSPAELWQAIQTVWEPRRVQMYQRHATVSTAAFMAFAPLEWLARRWGRDGRLAQALVAGLSGVYAAAMGPSLEKVTRMLHQAGLGDVVLENEPAVAWTQLQAMPEAVPVREALAHFLLEHGHRCPAEPEILLPRWAEAPEQVVALVAGYLQKGTQETAVVKPSSQTAQQSIEQRLGPVRRAIFRWVLRRAQAQVRRRDNSRHFMAKLELPRRQLFIALGHCWAKQNRLAVAEDIFFLTHDEIEAALSSESTADLQQTTAARRAAYEFWCDFEPPEALNAAGQPLSPPSQAAGEALTGIPASSGVARGPVRMIHRPEEAERLKPGDILVTLATDPGWTPVFPLVGGLVLVYGGQLSHGAIVAREYGVPAVVSVAEAMTRLQEGMMVTVDGSNGRITFD
jgi:phosphohistidine swiveling domain-containing protein